MEPLFADAHGNIEQISTLFGQLEKYVGHPNEVSIEDTIKSKLDALNSIFDRLEVFVLKEHPSRRQASRLRLNQMKYDATHLNSSLQSFQKKRYRREREHSDREDLLNRRFTTNDTTSINIDYSIQHHNSLQNAHRGIDDMLNQGYHVLNNLREQGSVMKGAKKRILDFTNNLSLSNTVMQLIERRAYQDKFVLFGGMLITLTIIFFLYMYFV